MRKMMHDRLMAELQADYGKVPPEEYLARLQVLQTPYDENANQYQKLREDYQFIMDEDSGAFRAIYSGDCQECTYQFNFDHKVETPLAIPADDDERAWSFWRERLLHPELEKNRR